MMAAPPIRRAALVVTLLALLMAGGVPMAAQQATTLGADGVLYTAKVGAYGALFPGGGEHDRDDHVLVLEIQQSDGSMRRLLAPGGATVAPDATPHLSWEGSSRRLFLVWEAQSQIHSTVRLISFDGSAWSEPLQISGNPFTKKSSPRLAVTRESYVKSDGADSVAGERTVLHIVWYEDDYGLVDVLYAPVVLDNGLIPSWLPPIFDLGQFVPEPQESGRSVSASLLRNPRVVAAADRQSVLVALVNDGTHQLVTFRIDALPVELSAVADELARFFAAEENETCDGDVRALAERARAHLVVIGTRFSTYARGLMADAVREWLLTRAEGECSSGGAVGLAERARAHLVVIGRRVLREVIVSAETESSFLLSLAGDAPGVRTDLSLTPQRVVAPPPALGDGAARIHVAGQGRASIVSWRSGNRLLYQEHDGTRWLPAQSLTLSESLTLQAAYDLLDAKAR